MRLRVNLSPLERTFVIDLNHHYHLASAIYRAIERADPSLSLELHRPGIPKLFTFSRLMIPGRRFRIEGEKMVVYGDSAHFFFSTMRNEIAEKLVEGLLSKPEIEISGAKFLVSEVRVMREKKIGRRERFVTLSPINVSRYAGGNGNGKVIDLYPKDAEFYEIIRQNLVKKYIAHYRRTPENVDLEIKPLSVKAKRVRIKDTYHRCVEMVFEAEGSKELLEVGYQAGFGAKNSMGLGMVKVV